MLTCNILLLWDHLEARVLFTLKFLQDKTCCKSNFLQKLPFTDQQEKTASIRKNKHNIVIAMATGLSQFQYIIILIS